MFARRPSLVYGPILMIVGALASCSGDEQVDSRAVFSRSFAAALCEDVVTAESCTGAPSCSELNAFDPNECRLAVEGAVLAELNQQGITEENWDDYRDAARVCLQAVASSACGDFEVDPAEGCATWTDRHEAVFSSACAAFAVADDDS